MNAPSILNIRYLTFQNTERGRTLSKELYSSWTAIFTPLMLISSMQEAGGLNCTVILLLVAIWNAAEPHESAPVRDASNGCTIVWATWTEFPEQWLHMSKTQSNLVYTLIFIQIKSYNLKFSTWRMFIWVHNSRKHTASSKHTLC